MNPAKKKPFFSILIPTYNRAKDLEIALFCILRQDFLDYEVVVCDNFSRDNTKDIVKKHKDKRVKYFRNSKNLSYLQNVKKALGHAGGQYVFFHADDDFLLYKTSLSEIYKLIKKNNVGYIRVNYLCFTPDKKNIFNYNLSKHFYKNKKIPKKSSSYKIISFMYDSDATFITGIIFKNTGFKSVRLIELIPWIDILYENIKNYGGYFISKPYILASWSRWVMRDNEPHHLYSLRDGKLAYEAQYRYIESKLTKKEYREFLHKRLTISFITILPAIKVYVGQKEMLKLVKRLKQLDPEINRSVAFWLYFLGAYFIPRFLFRILKGIYFKVYTKKLEVKDKSLLKELDKIKGEYF